MQRLGHTRSAHKSDHLLQTPETFVRAPLPGLRNATAIVHISPARGARFTQYTVELDADGELPPAAEQRFVFVLDGEIDVGDRAVRTNEFAYVPAGHAAPITASAAA